MPVLFPLFQQASEPYSSQNEAFMLKVPEAGVVGHGVVGVVGAKAITATVLKTMQLPHTTCNIHGNASPYLLELLVD
jgi:hypothetical protein